MPNFPAVLLWSAAFPAFSGLCSSVPSQSLLSAREHEHCAVNHVVLPRAAFLSFLSFLIVIVDTLCVVQYYVRLLPSTPAAAAANGLGLQPRFFFCSLHVSLSFI